MPYAVITLALIFWKNLDPSSLQYGMRMQAFLSIFGNAVKYSIHDERANLVGLFRYIGGDLGGS
jgi:hypothetical protein